MFIRGKSSNGRSFIVNTKGIFCVGPHGQDPENKSFIQSLGDGMDDSIIEVDESFESLAARILQAETEA